MLLGTLTFAPPPAAPRSSGGIDVWEILMISIGSLLVAAGLTLLWTRHGQYTLLLNGHESRHPSRPGSNAAAASPKRNYDSRAGKHGSDHASEVRPELKQYPDRLLYVGTRLAAVLRVAHLWAEMVDLERDPSSVIHYASGT